MSARTLVGSGVVHGLLTDDASSREQFARLLRQLLDRGGLTQATLARRLRHRGIAHVTEPRVSDWVHSRYLPRQEAVVFAIEAILAEAGVAVGEGELVARYWAARREPRQPAAPAAARLQRAMRAAQDPTGPQISDESPQFPEAAQSDIPPPGAQSALVPPLDAFRHHQVSNLPPRNPNFTGRDRLLASLTRSLDARRAAAAVAVHGLGGVGKTQLVLEYAHRHAGDYDVIWWVTADQPATISSQLVALAHQLGVPEQGEQAQTVTALLGELRHRNHWLLIFDNAEDPRDLRPYWPPGGGGHVLVTSRNPTWRGIATTIGVDVLSRKEAVGFLHRRLGRHDRSLGALAEALGDLPLALEQAAAYLEETDSTPAAYLNLLRERAGELFALGRPATSEQTIASTWTVSLQRLREQAPAAEELLTVCAFLGADDIPRTLFTEHADQLPERLATTMSDSLAAGNVIGILRRYALITTSPDTMSMHRLVQMMVRCQLDPADEDRWAASALHLLRAAFPPERTEYEAGPIYAALVPHALAISDHAEQLEIDSEATAWLLNETGSYLWQQAAHRQAYSLLERALAIAKRRLDPDHPITARSLNLLGVVSWSKATTNVPAVSMSRPWRSASASARAAPTWLRASTTSPVYSKTKATLNLPAPSSNVPSPWPRHGLAPTIRTLRVSSTISRTPGAYRATFRPPAAWMNAPWRSWRATRALTTPASRMSWTISPTSQSTKATSPPPRRCASAGWQSAKSIWARTTPSLPTVLLSRS